MHGGRRGGPQLPRPCLAVSVLKGAVADAASGLPELNGVVIARSGKDDLAAHVLLPHHQAVQPPYRRAPVALVTARRPQWQHHLSVTMVSSGSLPCCDQGWHSAAL